MSISPFLLAPLAAISAVAAGSAATAATPAAPVRIVSFADLDLSAAAGRERLDRRLLAAARSVCGTAAATDLRGKAEVRLCQEETLASALADRRLGEVLVVEFVPAGTR